MAKFFPVGLDLLRRQGTEISVPQSADKERAEYAAIAAAYAPVEGQAQQQPLLIADDGDRFLVRIDRLDRPAYHRLHLFQAVNFLLIGGAARLYH